MILTSSNDWRIHKRLVEAGGISERIYIYNARGGCKFIGYQELLVDLLSTGRKVVYVRRDDIMRDNGYRDTIMDEDILTLERYERADRLINEILHTGRI